MVAGQHRGRRLVAPDGDAVRPTSDRVREAVFNALGSLDVVHDAAVVDLFAGSGALGIEALSRGARRVDFLDISRASLRAVEANLDALGLADAATVRRADALEVLSTGGPWDLALADPPYAFDAWDELLEGLDATIVVIESDHAVRPPSCWEVLRERRYGDTVVVIARSQDRDDRGRPNPEDRS